MHEPDPLKTLRENGKHDLISYGHTHRPTVEKENGRLIINPGEGGGWTSGRATFAIADLKTMEAELLVIGESGDSISLDG